MGDSLAALPRLKRARFTGEYPIARLDFEDESLPVTVSLEAFTPFVPLDVDDSSLPVAILQYRIAACGSKPVDLALAFSLLNAVGYDGKAPLTARMDHAGFGQNTTRFRQEDAAPGLSVSGLDMTTQKYAPKEPLHGSLALLTLDAHASACPAWRKSPEDWLATFSADGELGCERSPSPSADAQTDFGSLISRSRLLPGETRTITFILAWYFPVRETYWNTIKGERTDRLRNYYGTRFNSAWEVAVHTASRLPELEEKTRAFRTALFSSTLPPYVLDAVSSQSSILRTNTCLLLEGKKFFGFEGCFDDAGSAPMNCSHVWNYEHALAFLFPELERSMRLTDFQHNLRPDGSMSFRTVLPLERRLLWKALPAADGQMGCILKLYREWQISGDNEFLRNLWPEAKRALEFAWVDWDADRDGVMEGEQHNTYDCQFFGPNTMVSTLYLGALRAGELMALAVGDRSAADSYRYVRESGTRKLEELWNGEYYSQRVPPLEQIQPWGKTTDDDFHPSGVVRNGEICRQYGDGCLSDQLLGQWWGNVLDLHFGLSRERISKALQSIYRYNFKHDFFQHSHLDRVFALNDEKGMVVCSWPKGHRPHLPVNYADEVWTGIEYQVAAHLIYEGFLEEGFSIVKAVRDRYDGRKRNPWNEVEFGSHYARALSSWSLLLALSGFTYSAVEHRIGFAPRYRRERFAAFFAAGSAWGTYKHAIGESGITAQLQVAFGSLRLRRVSLNNELNSPRLTLAVTGPAGNKLERSTVKAERHSLEIDLGDELVIPIGRSVTLEVSYG
jgi:uncharacterized protein (DUF608 family)